MQISFKNTEAKEKAVKVVGRAMKCENLVKRSTTTQIIVLLAELGRMGGIKFFQLRVHWENRRAEGDTNSFTVGVGDAGQCIDDNIFSASLYYCIQFLHIC